MKGKNWSYISSNFSQKFVLVVVVLKWPNIGQIPYDSDKVGLKWKGDIPMRWCHKYIENERLKSSKLMETDSLEISEKSKDS